VAVADIEILIVVNEDEAFLAHGVAHRTIQDLQLPAQSPYQPIW